MLLTRDFIWRKKSKRSQKKAASHKFVSNTCDTESSENKFQGLTPTRSKRVRKREGQSLNDS